ncbi:MAG: radical SAM protein [Myxococcales bacterium]|nr:radical SAM protein [Myxococcales bacterium]
MRRKLQQLAINTRYAFNPRKPRLVARLASAVTQTMVLGRQRLRYVDFSIGYACNLHCQHCFATALTQRGNKRVMKPDDYGRVVREAMALGAVNFSFQGGEPLLFHQLDEIIGASHAEQNLISVTTNGTLLDPAQVVRLKRLGVDILTVSLDSDDPAEHDRFRGKAGAYDKTLAGIELARAEGLKVTLGTVVTHDSLHSPGIQGLLQRAIELRCVLNLIMPVPAGRWAGDEAMLLTQDDLAYIDHLTHVSPYIRTDFQANWGGYGCGAAKEILYITPYGDVLTCPFMHIAAGNIFEESVAQARARALANPYFSTYHDTCLVSTNPEFIEQHLSKTFDAEHLPIPWEDAFGGS